MIKHEFCWKKVFLNNGKKQLGIITTVVKLNNEFFPAMHHSDGRFHEKLFRIIKVKLIRFYIAIKWI